MPEWIVGASASATSKRRSIPHEQVTAAELKRAGLLFGAEYLVGGSTRGARHACELSLGQRDLNLAMLTAVDARELKQPSP